MGLIVVPVWTQPDGLLTSPVYPAVRSEREVPSLIERARIESRRDRSADLQVRIVDEVTWACVAVVRPKARPL